jgi:hypothetical protein
VESMLWIVGGIIAILVAILLVPVLVIGTWFVVMAVIMGIALTGAYGCWTENGRGRPERVARSRHGCGLSKSQVRTVTRHLFLQDGWCEKFNLCSMKAATAMPKGSCR